MSMKIARLSSLLLAFALAGLAFCFDFPALAVNSSSQNSNSSTTTMENSNTGKSTRGRRRSGRRAAPQSESTAAAETEPDEASGPTEQTDLSGSYTGTFACSDVGVSGDTTLTIAGNQYTLADGKSGRIVASTTRGYTAVAMQFGEWVAATPMQPGVTPTVISMRAKKSGESLTLTTVPGATRACTFTPAKK